MLTYEKLMTHAGYYKLKLSWKARYCEIVKGWTFEFQLFTEEELIAMSMILLFSCYRYCLGTYLYFIRVSIHYDEKSQF